MKLSASIRICIPAMLLGCGGLTASTVNCAAVSGTNLNNFVTNVGSCSIGDLTFSNFFFNYTAGVNTGSPLGVASPATPNTNTQITLSFNEITDGSSDPEGTVGTVANPVYQLIAAYTGGNVVNEFQNEHFFVQYLVTDTAATGRVNQVDASIAGGATTSLGGSAVLTNKSICDGGQFVQTGGIPSGSCSTGNRLNLYQVVNDAGGGLAIPTSLGVASDSSLNYSAANGGEFVGGNSAGSRTFGVYDQADMNGGTTNSGATANITSVQNDFVELAPAVIPTTPEPGTFVLAGVALAGLSAIRRKRRGLLSK